MNTYFETVEEDENSHTIDKIHSVPKNDETPLGIIIDNGSYRCRAGWSSEENPMISFRPLCAKLKANEVKNLDFVSDDDKLVLQNGGYLVGNDLHPFDYLRYGAKSPFDNDIVTNFDYFEQVMDYVFYKLGLASSKNVSLTEVPLVFTEPILNPGFSRQSTLEILFESYGIPSINLSIDALLSLKQTLSENNIAMDCINSFVIRSGFHSTHIIPIVDGVTQWNSCKRLNIGGFHATDLMLKTMQLKYPSTEPTKYFIPIYDALGIPSLSVAKAEFLKEKYCYLSQDYIQELQLMAENQEYYDGHTVRVFNNKQQYDSFMTARDSLSTNASDTSSNNSSEPQIPEFKTLSACEKWLAEKRNELQQLHFKLQKMQFTLSSQTKDHTLKSKRSAASVQRQKSKIAAEIHDAEDETFEDWSLYDGLQKTKKKKKKKKSSTKEDVVDSKLVKKVSGQVDDLKKLIQQTELKYFGEKKTDYIQDHFVKQYKRNTSDPLDNTGIRLTVERIRIPEIIFQPHMANKDQIGVSEIIENTLQEFNATQREAMIQNIFICGGNTLFKGFNERIESEVRKVSPVESEIRIIHESNFDTSAWKGGRSLLIDSSENDSYWMKLSDYQEQGAERISLKQHTFSNIA
ncbi:hypothetical protein C9374_002265 [Naegleria lovaniensis]|uniref:Actin-related protein 5 n=1 Tax=Naegleria lovaniensis TaxID=51637 RepID=A0AA88GQH3_NAELO|nr:uncharacterized protein C9374_002265 [Naegleria lovaniensis]KAG2386521.1 hypothetical protein C9374_002265 [Naegleria lovaniensis]